MTARSTLLALPLALACLVPLAALAQYQWVDKDGRKVFSDRPPPADVPANKIVRQPRGAAPRELAMTPPDSGSPTGTAAPAAAGASSASAPRLSGKDKTLEEKKKQAESAEAAKKKEEDQKLAALKEENCTRARESRASFDAGVRIMRTNAQGERYYLDDQQRAAESARLDKLIASDCKK